jgi:hypothetical protein
MEQRDQRLLLQKINHETRHFHITKASFNFFSNKDDFGIKKLNQIYFLLRLATVYGFIHKTLKIIIDITSKKYFCFLRGFKFLGRLKERYDEKDTNKEWTCGYQ